ncbi:MAG: glycogen(starch) synthase [Verrucomicrobia bacterium]|nr:MAG: glycogen(starch) synthase [Verrucomicrobiota bacterium]
MRAMIWTDSDCFSGTERHCLELSQGLEAIGVSTMVGSRKGSPLVTRAEHAGLRCVCLDAASAPFGAVREVARLLKMKKVDIIHAHNGVTTFLACLAAGRAGRGKVVATQHFIRPARQGRRGLARVFSEQVHRWVRSRVGHWIAISGAVASAMEARGDAAFGDIRIVMNGVAAPLEGEPASSEARQWIGFSPGVPLVLCPARLEPEKGHDVLLEALAVLRRETVDFQAVFMGGGSLHQTLERRIAVLGLGECVRLVGYQSRPDVWMRASDMVVLPSAEEPFGLVLPEAMSRGLPVVAAAAGGPLEIVTPGSGVLFRPGDAADLASRLRELIGSAPLRNRLGSGAAARWESHFNLERMAGEVASVYVEAGVRG